MNNRPQTLPYENRRQTTDDRPLKKRHHRPWSMVNGLFIFALLIVITTLSNPVVSADENQWSVEYYNNRWHSGEPVRVQSEGNVANGFEHYWGVGSPYPEIQENEFSVRWTGTAHFPESATYEFKTSSDDGIRVWIDGRMVIDSYFSKTCLLYTSPSPRDLSTSRMPSSA